MRHALRPLLVPASIALVGASMRPGALGRIVFENIRAAGYTGQLYAVNPNRRQIFDTRVYRSLAAIGAPVDLAIVVTPPTSVAAVLTDAARAAISGVVLITAAPAADMSLAHSWRDTIAAQARSLGIRLIGPGAFGVVRTDIGLNATFADVAAAPGRLALISQSGAVCTAMIDFATAAGIGFSSVLSLGDETDVDVAELLDALLTDAATDGILVYIEEVTAARRFLSALRAAARAKPVVVLKAGRSLARATIDATPTEDEVFDAALHRAGTVRVHTYTQLFAAARALAAGRIPRGDRIAIVANGRGAGLLAADRAHDIGVSLATLDPATLALLESILPSESMRGNPVDVRGTADADRYRSALLAVLGDENVDAVIALHVPRPAATPVQMAVAVADAARTSTKLVLAAWLGAIERPDVHAALGAGGVANFYTPENAVEAFSYLGEYRRNQQWLLEAPPSQADMHTPDLQAADAIRARQPDPGRLMIDDARALLAAFGIAQLEATVVHSIDEARAAAHAFHYPVMLARDGDAPRRAVAAGARALARDYARLDDGHSPVRVIVAPGADSARSFAIGVHVDPTFGPVITLGGAVYFRRSRSPSMLPPLSVRLASDLVAACGGADADIDAGAREALVQVLLRVSALVCALPWVCRMTLEPVIVGDGHAIVADAHIDIDPARASVARYAHMAIHPYPAEFAGDAVLADGTRLLVRPMRPDDAELEKRFVAALSDETRYLRFFYQLHELTPMMLARFTQVDYDRELALVAFARDAQGDDGGAFIAVARYILDADGTTAEFAIVVADAWQRRGVGRLILQRLIDAARANGVTQFTGLVLRGNGSMLRFVHSLGFAARTDASDGEQMVVTRSL
ncbi:MAG: GNAT family N-acetyltransferase [Casimicrobiaceae bacterium]